MMNTMAIAGPSRLSAGPVKTSFGGPTPNLSSMPRLQNTRNILMELRKICQHPYLSAPMLEDETLPLVEKQKKLIGASGKLVFLKQLLPKLKERGHRVLLFSQFKIALDRIEDFLDGEGIRFLRLDGDVQQAVRQKSMDAFNAPGSEFFIFLLTTRAGGVGINLATADTVIIYDPDFNPHQDLQAIARAHRFGQQKPVLVFKLMTKDTVEEQIVFKGKKKMVLDHLVVQNLNTAEEEVDIDSIIMHGTKALYDKTEGNERGINWDSQTVDNLIDDAEKSASAEWEDFKLRWKLEDEAKERGEKPEPSKEARTFGFAKIWEAGAGSTGLMEIEELTEEKELEEDEGALAELAKHAIPGYGEGGEGGEVGKRQFSAAHAKEKERQARIAKELEMTLALGDTPVKKKKWKKGKKGKGKWEPEEASSDPDFAVVETPNSEDSDYPGEQPDGGEEVLLGEEDRTGVVGKKGMIGQQHGPEAIAARKAAKALARAQKRAGIIPEGEIPGSSSKTTSPSKGGYSHHRLTDAEKVARKQAKFKAKEDARLEALAAGRDPKIVGPRFYASGLVLPPNHPSSIPEPDPYADLFPETPPVDNPPKPSLSDIPPRQKTLAQIKEGQEVLQWLYHVLKEFADENALAMWAKIAVTELPTAEREGYYRFLSRSADAGLVALGYKAMFENETQVVAVRRLIMLKRDIMPASAVRAAKKPMLPVPQGMGVVPNGVANGIGAPGNAVAGPSGAKSTTPSTTPVKKSALGNPKKPPTPSHISHIELPNGIPKTKKIKPHPVPLPGMYNFPAQIAPSSAGNGSTTPTSPALPPYPYAKVVAESSSLKVCPACMKPGHEFGDCTVRLSLHDLAMIRKGVMTLEGEIRLKGLAEVERQEQAYRDHGVDVPVHPCVPGQIREANYGKTKVNSRQSTPLTIPTSNGHNGKRPREGASQPPTQIMSPLLQSHFHQILERHKVEGEAGSSKRPRLDATPSGSPILNSMVGVGKCPPCALCGGPIHLVTECPLVKGGSASLTAELYKLHPSHERYSAVSSMLDASNKLSNSKSQPSHVKPPQGQSSQHEQLLRTLQTQLQRQQGQIQQPQITQSQPLPPPRAESPAPPRPICVFCGLTCGKTLKGCTEAFGGRKALKTKIRELQCNGKVNDVANEMRLDQLFILYGEWPK